MQEQPTWDGIPQFYKDPLPSSRRGLKKLRAQLIQRRTTSMPGSYDYELVKEKLNQVLNRL